MSQFYCIFQAYCLKFVEFSGTHGKRKHLTSTFFDTFQNVLKILKNGANNINDKIRIGVWRHCLHVLGNGGGRLESIIRKSPHFVKGLELSYLEGDSNIFTDDKAEHVKIGRKQSDSGYSSQLSSAFEGESNE